MIGIQCKARVKLTQYDISPDIEAAKTLNPKLSKFIIATTALRDTKLQDYVNSVNNKHHIEGLFDVEIKFWDDIEEELSKESNADIASDCYGKCAFAKIQIKNLSLGRAITISIGIDGKNDTTYGIVIGKISDDDILNNKFGLAYWKGRYFIVNLIGRLMETFSLPAFESDLERAFPLARDNFIITKWLNSVKFIDDLIKCDCNESMVFQISQEEYSAWLEDQNNDRR